MVMYVARVLLSILSRNEINSLLNPPFGPAISCCITPPNFSRPLPPVILINSFTPPSASMDALRINLSLFNSSSRVVSLPLPLSRLVLSLPGTAPSAYFAAWVTRSAAILACSFLIASGVIPMSGMPIPRKEDSASPSVTVLNKEIYS